MNISSTSPAAPPNSTASRPPADPKPPAEYPSTFLNYRTKTDLRIPVEGTWQVIWGGRDVQHNYHAAYPDQRFAYDLLSIAPNGSTHTSDGTRNEQYHAWNRPLVAPGNGVVVEAVDGLPDNRPGVMDPEHALGNHIIIDHGNGEYSFLAHMRNGSVAVHTGDTIAQGHPLGRTGNSGNTTEPHLHYHLQNSPVPFEGDGLPAQFQHFMSDGGYIERGEPGQFHSVRNARPQEITGD